MLISLVVSSQSRNDVTDAAVDKLCTALGSTLNLEALLATGEQVIVDAISKVGFCRLHSSSSNYPLVLHGIDDQQKNLNLDMSDRLCSACETIRLGCAENRQRALLVS